MSIKTFLLSLILVVIAALLTAAMVVFGNAFINDRDKADGDTHTSFFSSKPKEAEAAYVEIKNLVITLRGDGGKERYLLLDLAVVTYNNDDHTLVEKVIPELKSSAVSLFAKLNYSQARDLSVAQMRQDLLNSFNATIHKKGDKKPVSDVLISKMIFQ